MPLRHGIAGGSNKNEPGADGKGKRKKKVSSQKTEGGKRVQASSQRTARDEYERERKAADGKRGIACAERG